MRYRRLKHSLQHWVEVPQWAACKRKHAPHQRLRKKTSSTEKEKGEIGKSGKTRMIAWSRLPLVTTLLTTPLLLLQTSYYYYWRSPLSSNSSSPQCHCRCQGTRWTPRSPRSSCEFFAARWNSLSTSSTSLLVAFLSLGELSLVAGGWSCYLSPGRDLEGYLAVIVMTFLFWINLPWTSEARELAETATS